MFVSGGFHILSFFSYYKKEGEMFMLKERVQAWYKTGENCSRIILRAAAEEYGIQVSDDILLACKGIQGGFGVGSFCSGLIAAVMVLGLMFDEETVKSKRIQFLFQVQERFGSLNCSRLSLLEEDCEGLLIQIGEILQDIIEG